MSSINSISGIGYSSSMQPPDPSKMVDKLFSKLDPTGKGYITKSDLQTAMVQMSVPGSSSGANSSGSSTSVDEIFKKIDTNGDGKITKDEMTSGMKNLASSLQGQINKTGRDAPPPSGPPPSGGSPSSSSSSGSTSSTQSSSTTKTYEKADTNQDGKVSEQEQLAYDLLQSIKSALASPTSSNTSKAASSTSSNSDNAASATSTGSDARIMKQIMNLMHAYSSTNSSSSSSGLSVTA